MWMNISEDLIVAFCGRPASGKTSLINLLLNQELKSSVGNIPATKIVTKIRYASHFQAWYESGGERIFVWENAVGSFISGETPLPENCTELVIGIPAEILKRGIVFLDTPGCQDGIELDRVTINAVQRSDVAVLCCSAVEFGEHFEQYYMRELEQRLGNFCLAVNYMDTLHSEEAYQKLRKCVNNLIAGRGGTAWRCVQEKLAFYTIGAEKCAALDGMDLFMNRLAERKELVKAFANIGKTRYNLLVRLEKTNDEIRNCRDLQYKENKAVAKKYAQDKAAYLDQLRRLSITEDSSVLPKPKRDEKALQEIIEKLNEYIRQKDNIYTLLKVCENDEKDWMKKYEYGVTEKSGASLETEVLRLQKQIEDTENEMLKILLPECRWIFGEKLYPQKEDSVKQEIEAFMKIRSKLPERVQALTGYEIAACGGSGGMSGFHFDFAAKSYLPFQMIGWSAFVGYLREWPHPYPGIAFRIARDCFGARSPLLYFEADSGFTYPDDGGQDDESRFIQRIYGNSSGITDLKVITNEGASPHRLEFRLTDAPQNFMVDLQDGQINTQLYGGYVIQIPICGEFDCSFGEITETGDVILHQDSFCMK